MKDYTKILLAIFLSLMGCSKPKANQPSVNHRTADENQIFALISNPGYLYPEGFYKINFGYYENTGSIKSLLERKHIWIELSTDDKNQALAWSDSSDKYSSLHGAIISGSETEKYFEFKRQNTTNAKDIFYSRIHKTSYFLPLLDRFKKSDTIGVYNGQLDTAKVKEFVEYLWSCGSSGIEDSKVIKSQTNEYNNYYEQYIKSVYIVGGDIGLKDSIYVNENYFKLDKSSRVLTVASKQVDAFEGN